MPDEVLLLVKRAEGCECPSVMGSGEKPELGMWHQGIWYQCPHGSTIAAIPVQVVECDWCGGIGAWIGLNGDPDPANPCEHCLGTGLRLEPKETVSA